MADRTSARVFGEIFNLLAEESDIERIKDLAKNIYKISGSCDFHPCQMGADDACVELGLAYYGFDPDYGDGVLMWVEDD